MKEELKEYLVERKNKENIVLLVFTEEQYQSRLQWEYDYEFEYQGQMYDVVESIHKDGIYKIRCYKDDKEKKLKEKMTHFLAFGFDDDVQKNESQKKLSNYFNCLYYETNKLELTYFIFNTQTIFSNRFKLLKTYLTPFYPPPKSI